MEDFKEAAKKAGKIVLKTVTALLFPIIVIICIILVLVSAFVYFITIDDGTYKEDDWSNAPYGASAFSSDTTISSDGSISTSMTPQELWDKLIENGSSVADYLDSPEELAKLIKAEMITKYPDTRPNPDEEINWDEVINGDSVQGIIKIRRADTDGNRYTMTYVDPATFQGYIDEYNSTGSETAKNNALSHFTLRQTAASTSSGNGGAIAAGEGVMTDISQKIIEATNNTPWPGKNLCAGWVFDVYDIAGIPRCGENHGSAYEAAKHHIISTDMSAIPIGASVYGTGSGSIGPYGHVGIYIGDGKVIDSQTGGIIVSTMEEWLSWQVDVLDGKQGWLGWGWEDNNRTRGTTDDPNITQSDGSDSEEQEKENEENADENGNVGEATEIPNSGDGYDSEYVSSAGITYKQFKQYKGTYANNTYWSGTISDSGCGPTSLAILASGLTNLNYTPADTAAEMNAKYGYTGAEPLKGEMEALGMTAEITYNPTAEQIQDNLRNGKVMLVSVTPATIFTNVGHLMALVDINEQGQVYISNPSSDTLNGWMDISEIMKGCSYIVTTDAGAAGIAKSNNDSNYVAVVATWRQVDTTVTTDDPNVDPVDTTSYSMTTTDINYEAMVKPYTMPFDYLWALLVVGEGKGFVLDLADLVYDSDIEITVHDNLTVNTDVDQWTYTLHTKSIVKEATITASCGGISETGTVGEHEHDPEPTRPDQPYTTTKTVVTQTNTVNIAVTRANVWIVDYQNEFTYNAPTSNTTTSENTKDPTDYELSSTGYGETYTCDEIEAEKSRLGSSVKQRYISSHTSNTTNNGSSGSTASPPEVTYKVNSTVEYYTRYINIKDSITNTIETTKYVAGTPSLKEKTDPDSEEPNFVTLFNDPDYERNNSSIISAADWLFEIIESNDRIKEPFLELTKYLLYKATTIDYGVTEFDFSIFYPGTLVSVGAGDYIVDTTKSQSEIVITDLNTLKQAFSWYSNDRVLQQYADFFLECQEKYNVNAVFAAAVAITESSAGTNIAIGGNNMFSISNGGQGNWNSYHTMEDSIESFFKLISGEYFTNGQYTVDSISRGNPPGTHMYCVPPDDWIKNTCNYMTEMFKNAGINVSTSEGSSATGDAIIQAARSKLGCSYVWGAAGPDTFDCSGLTQWCYKQAGISITHQSETQKNEAKKVVPVSEARPGDILWKSGHVGIYIGNGQYIHAPQPGDVVKISNNVNTFTYALQFF